MVDEFFDDIFFFIPSGRTVSSESCTVEPALLAAYVMVASDFASPTMAAEECATQELFGTFEKQSMLTLVVALLPTTWTTMSVTGRTQ